MYDRTDAAVVVCGLRGWRKLVLGASCCFVCVLQDVSVLHIVTGNGIIVVVNCSSGKGAALIRLTSASCLPSDTGATLLVSAVGCEG